MTASKLDSTFWYHLGEGVTGTLRELLDMAKPHSKTEPIALSTLISKTLPITKTKNPKRQQRIQQRIDEVDLSCPITLIMKEGNVHTVADGHHRIHSALQKGMTDLPATLIPFESLTHPFNEIFKIDRAAKWH